MFIEKVGQGKYGYWATFEYNTENLSIKGIANTKLDNLQENTTYENLVLQIISKNNKMYYNILEK